jgi:rare lipoprotein A (peptidoglycan hydrolase)
MSRRRTLSTPKKLALLAGAAAVAGGGAFALAATSNAAPVQNANSTVCQGLATAVGNNQRFIDAQRAAPDAQSEARIANREAVIKEIGRQQKASGCEVGESTQDSQATAPATKPPAAMAPGEAAPGEAAPGGEAGTGGGAAAGEQVCAGSTVTLSGENGAPAASSNQFPAGTKLRVTNLDNNKSTTVEVTSVSGSCVLLNNAAFEQVREPGKFLIRKARIERVG